MTRLPYRQCTTRPESIAPALWDSHYLVAARGGRPSRIPVWLMRQAGRYMAEYREVRAEHGFLGLCKNPQVAAEVTEHAQKRIDADVAIIFADILLILETLGLDLAYVAGDGPVLKPPIRNASGVAALGDPEQAAADCSYVAEAVRLCRGMLADDIPLIGFCGGPFTLASYACEGGASRQFAATKSLMYADTPTWHKLLETVVAALIPYAKEQVSRGAQAFQIFESWGGELTAVDYREFVLPHLKTLACEIPSSVPLTIFGARTGHLLPLWKEAGADIVGIDTTTDLPSSWQSLGGPDAVSVQGNLDPALILGPRERLLTRTQELLKTVGDGTGYIFNLGHGVMKESDVDQVAALVEAVHAFKPGA